MQRSYFVYILTNASHRSLYVGMTSDLGIRVWQHKNGYFEGFTKKYRLNVLVHWEEYSNVWDAISREKQIKRWRRKKKVALVNRMNPDWRDLAADWYDDDPTPGSGNATGFEASGLSAASASRGLRSR